MSQVQRISKNNTTIHHHTGSNNDQRQVWLHQTCIVTVTPDEIVLNTGGWYTATTRTRMNQVSNEWGLGYGVSFADKPSVRYRGQVYYFDEKDQVRLSRKEVVQ